MLFPFLETFKRRKSLCEFWIGCPVVHLTVPWASRDLSLWAPAVSCVLTKVEAPPKVPNEDSALDHALGPIVWAQSVYKELTLTTVFYWLHESLVTEKQTDKTTVKATWKVLSGQKRRTCMSPKVNYSDVQGSPEAIGQLCLCKLHQLHSHLWLRFHARPWSQLTQLDNAYAVT